mgnify:FL=1
MNPGKVFKRARLECGESLRTFAARLGVSKSTLWKIERGSTPPSKDTIYRFLALMGYSMVQFCIESFEDQDYVGSMLYNPLIVEKNNAEG